tara:strand:+ start:32170 stop:32685 length:516 start_codon:yes stop_codon:yes gene_type:complete
MKEVAMKSLKQYLVESEKTYEFRLRSLHEISDENMDRIESHMKKYNMESMGAPKKTVMHRPRGFADVGAREVYMYDIKTKLPVTPNSLQEEIASICGHSIGEMIVNNMNESEELWEGDEDKDADEEANSVLADGEYKDAEKIKVEDHYGDAYNEKMIKNAPRKELQTEYKV